MKDDIILFTKKDADAIAEIEYQLVHEKEIGNLNDFPSWNEIEKKAIDLWYYPKILKKLPKHIVDEMLKFLFHEPKELMESCSVPLTKKRIEVYNANRMFLCSHKYNPLFQLLKPKILLWNRKLKGDLCGTHPPPDGPDPPITSWEDYYPESKYDLKLDDTAKFKKEDFNQFLKVMSATWKFSIEDMAMGILNRYVDAEKVSVNIEFLEFETEFSASDVGRVLKIKVDNFETKKEYHPRKKRKLN